MREVKGPGFVKFLYNQNPFYLISAAVILYGFRTATQEAAFATNPWFLASLFAGYTTLLALTAWLIVRFGRVWDDARSIFLVLLLLFMALSASFDGLFISNPTTAIALAAAGFTFAVVVCEALVWSLGIRFRALFRGPLYAMLAISFFYPYLFSLQASIRPDLDSRFVILLFPFLVSATILSLIPAIRKTKRYVSKNGTPWNWPLYPYSLFFLAIVGLIGRTVMMGLSFDPSAANGMLGTWMFVPIFLSVVWLIFEIGTTEGSDDLQFLAMMLMPIAIALAIPWPFFSNTNFYDQLTAEVGSPVWMATLAVVTMYFVAWIEKVENAGFFLTMALLGAAMIQQDGSLVEDFASMQGWPWLVLAVWSIASWDRIYRSSCWLLASCSVSVPIGNALTPWLANSYEPLTALSGHETAVAANILLVLSCAIACVFNSQFSRQLKVCLAVALPGIALLTTTGALLNHDRAMLTAGYGCILAALGITIFLFTRSRIHLSAAAISLGASFVAAFPMLEFSIGNDHFRLAGFLGAGLACFLAGLMVSAVKAGWMKKVNSSFGKLQLEFREAFPVNETGTGAEQSTV